MSSNFRTQRQRWKKSGRQLRWFMPALLLQLVCCQLNAQSSDVAASLLSHFTDYSRHHLPEKMFVHTDKNCYAAGEIMWFKVYDVDGFYNLPLTLNAVAYLELLDRNNQPVLQTKLAVELGDGKGSIYLPDSLAPGTYRLRAYSNWMKNAPPEMYFEKAITILSNSGINASSQPTKAVAPDIQFFPEGGNLVAGLESTVAFRAADQFGKGLECDGMLIDNGQDTVIRFHTFRNGMGKFRFRPMKEHEYIALVTCNAVTRTIPLPVPQTEGLVMQLKAAANDRLLIAVDAIGEHVAADGDPVYLFVHSRGVPVMSAAGSLQQGKAFFSISRKQLKEGVSQFSVLNAVGQPVCERLYFTYPDNKMTLALSTRLPTYGERKKITVDIVAATKERPSAADLSMAVVRLDSAGAITDEKIDSYLLLSADLPGFIESPENYFNNRDSATEIAMDNLMLTQGWRRFRLKDAIGNRTAVSEYLPEHNGHIITGKITNYLTSKPGNHITGYASVPGRRTQFHPSESDSNGVVRFEMRDFRGNAALVIQTNTVRDSLYRLEIMSPFSTAVSGRSLPGQKKTTDSATTKELLFNTQIQQIYLGDSADKWKSFPIDTGYFYGQADVKYNLDDYTRFTTMEEVMREYIEPINVFKRAGKLDLVMLNRPGNIFFRDEPLVLVDGVPFFDLNQVMHLDPLKIRKIELMTREYYLGSEDFSGIMNCATYRGNLDGIELNPRANVITYEGLQLEREFYAPVYDTENQANSRLPDFRNVLCWMPDCSTGPDGKQQVSFYSSDLPGRYAVIVQGLDSGGHPAAATTYFTVKP